MIRDESQQHVIHRLEAFSDIIIGFSLAQLALTLEIKGNGAAYILAHPEPLIAFVITFSVVCGMWWAHHKLFLHYFVPNAGMIILNFVTLAGVSFAVYSVQLMLHEPHTSMDFAFYEGALGAVYTLLAAQYLYGWYIRRSQLPAGVASRGLAAVFILLGIGIMFAAGAYLAARYGVRVKSFQYIAYAVVVYVIAVRIFFRTRNARLAHTGGPQKPTA